jgi:integrase
MNSPKWDGQRWRIQVQKDGKRYSFSSKTPGPKGRKEVIQKYDNWYYGEASGEKSVLTVCKQYLEDVKMRKGEHSAAYEQYECYIRLYIVPVCGSKKICKMTLRDWQSLLNEASGQKKPLSEKTLKNLRAIIMAIVKFGYQDYQCELLRGTLYIPQGHSRKEKEILQRDDVRRLLEPSPLWYHPLFCFLLLTGMRPGEALGLKVSDIEGDRVIVRRAVNARGHITDGKNENARRMIPIDGLAKGILHKTIRRNEDYNLRTEWIFCSADGSQGKQSRMRKHWQKLKEERDLPGTVYSLRHTFISMMKNVMPEQMIKDIVGHSVSMDTFGTYGHILSSDTRQAAEIISLTFGEDFGEVKSTSDGNENK